MLVQSYLQTISNDPFSQLHCFSCQATLTVSFFTHSNHPVNFHLSQCIQHELLLLDDKQRVKTYNLSFILKQQSSVQIFLYKVHILCSKCLPPAKAYNTFRNLAYWSLSAASHSRYAAVHFSAPEWSRDLSEVCEMPQALHPTHDSQVGWGLVNLVVIHPWRWSRYTVKSEKSLGGCS